MSKVKLDKNVVSPKFEYQGNTLEFAVKDDVNPTKWGFYSNNEFVELNPSALPKLPNNIVLGTPIINTAAAYYTGVDVETGNINVTLPKGDYIYVECISVRGNTIYLNLMQRKVVSGKVESMSGSLGCGTWASTDANANYSESYISGIKVLEDSVVKYSSTNIDSSTCSSLNYAVFTIMHIPITYEDPE